MNSRRRFHVALVFVWALAHGMWMGAVWHAAGAHGSTESAASPCHCRAKSAQHNVTNAAVQTPNCAVCALATIAPEQPAQFALPLLPYGEISIATVLLREIPRGCEAHLPPGRAPPRFS